MGIDDFFKEEDDFLDFESDIGFEEFNNSKDFFSAFYKLRDSLTIKHAYFLIAIVFIGIIGYFINYRFNLNNPTETAIISVTTTTTSTTTTTPTTTTTTAPTTTAPTTTAPTTTNPTNLGNSNEPLTSTVMVLLPDCGYVGSGTVISKLGFILTNQHVVSDDNFGCNNNIIIAISASGDKDPIPKYFAKIVKESEFLDIAILEITASYDGTSLPRACKNICFGSSDDVELGDELLIWGYPDLRWTSYDSLGRIDVSQGFVSGFDAESNVSEKAWFSLSSTISSGNSGGGAYNSAGELVGVTTAVTFGNFSSRGLIRPINVVLDYFDSFYFDSCR